jgi:hypothetical protein
VIYEFGNQKGEDATMEFIADRDDKTINDNKDLDIGNNIQHMLGKLHH